MGGGLTVTGLAMFCEGNTVVDELNRVFGHPGTVDYDIARGNKQLFYDIAYGPRKGRWRDLHKAYMACKVADSPNWPEYLSTLGAKNIIAIAKARYDGLSGPGHGKPMHTKTHLPGNEHAVNRTDKPDGSIEIDSPFEADPEC